MCGIAGKLSSRGPVDAPLLERMCGALEHRGPDARGTFLDDGVGLGVQRLRVIDLETGDQPIFNEDRSVVVIHNGEIYNYVELRDDLRRRGHRLATRSDTEVIVHLYEEHGPDCVRLLRGMFAFALWDRRRRRLVLARDRVGKKPLFYAQRDGCLWFGSEARAILADRAVPRDVDWPAIDRFLQYQYVPHPQSAFAALRKLPPAHVLVWEHGTARTSRYWRLSFRGRSSESPGEQRARVRELLVEATRLRLRSDVPVGAFLSGGVDSSAVVAAAAHAGGPRLRTFSIGVDAPGFDESAHARAVAQMYGTEHEEWRVGPDDVEALLPRLTWHYGEPFADQSAIPTLRLSELASRHVTVALNGDGGDESFAGYARYAQALARARRWWPRRKHARRYAAHMARFTAGERRELYEPAFRASLGERSWLPVIEQPYAASDATEPLERLLDVDVCTYLPDDLLVKVDVATMAHALEARSPFLDHELMELAATLPPSLKLADGAGKRILKEAVREWLPSSVLDRPKMGFSIPLAAWFRGPLRHLPADVLLDRAALGRGLFRPRRIEAMVREHREARADHSDGLWGLIVLELWLRAFVDREPVAPAAAQPA